MKAILGTNDHYFGFYEDGELQDHGEWSGQEFDDMREALGFEGVYVLTVSAEDAKDLIENDFPEYIDDLQTDYHAIYGGKEVQAYYAKYPLTSEEVILEVILEVRSEEEELISPIAKIQRL